MAINKNFIIKHGLEVNDDLIFADLNSGKVGIGTRILNHTLGVDGDIKCIALYVTGIGSIQNIISTAATFANIDIGNVLTPVVNFQTIGASVLDLSNGVISINDYPGVNGQYLVSTGDGVEWTDFKASRAITTINATPGQTDIIDISYIPGSIDVFINGVKLSTSEYSATNGLSITLGAPCFGDELIEVISYNISSFSYGDANVSGIVTATGGFVSSANTSPVQIQVSGNNLTFNVVGIGSTTLRLF